MIDNSIQAHLKQATQALAGSGSPLTGSPSPALDAQVLMTQALDKPRSYLMTWPEKALDESQLATFNRLLERRLAGEPIAYIVGEREFWSLPLTVSTSTLIPRPDTECLVEQAIEKIQQIENQKLIENQKKEQAQGDILDLGTGTGAIALALASEFPERHVIGIDLMPEAQQLAQLNAEKCGIENVQFLQGSWFEPLKAAPINEGEKLEYKKFDCIVSNPPYIDPNDPHLSQGDVRFEPKSALVADENGLADLRHIATESRQFLNPNGWLLMEHGYDQAQAVCTMLQELGYQQVETKQDYHGKDRLTLGCYL